MKPDDWDEDAPFVISDPSAQMPAGWLEDEPEMVPDPNAQRPPEWNDDEDGDWSPPMVKNSACIDAPGCGTWSAPMIRNPNYKGKWKAPKIPNPAYKGEWKAKQIDNPDYFDCEHPHAVADIDAVGMELWTMQSGILFDNIAMSRSIEAMKAFVDRTWKVRNEIERAIAAASMPDAQKSRSMFGDMGSLEKVVTGVMVYAHEHPVVAATIGVG